MSDIPEGFDPVDYERPPPKPVVPTSPAPKPVAPPPKSSPKPAPRRPAPLIAPADIAGSWRTTPYSAEAEEELLACCFVEESDTLMRCRKAKLPSPAFYSPVNRLIYEKLCELRERGVLASVPVVYEELKTSRLLEAVGGVAYLMRVSNAVSSTIQDSYFIERVRGLYLQREVIRLATDAAEKASVPGADVVELTQELRRRIEALDAEASANAGAFTVWTVEDLRHFIPPKDVGLLAENASYPLWSIGAVALLLGAAGIGKTRSSLQLAVCQITGRKWGGLLTLGPPRRWLFVGNENSTTRLKHDLLAMLAGFSAEETRLVEEHLFIQVLGTAEDSFISLDDPAAISRWRATLAKIKPDVLVIDPWEAVVIGGDVNDPAATRETVRRLQSLMVRSGVPPTILIVHHARQGAEATRRAVGYDASAFAKGSKTLTAIARLQINVAAGDSENGGKLVIACGKCNDAKPFTTRGVKLDEKTQSYGIDDDFDLQSWIDDVEGKRTGKTVTIVDVVATVRNGTHKTKDIVDTLRESHGASERGIKRRLTEAVDKGYLSRTLPKGSYTLGARHLETA